MKNIVSHDLNPFLSSSEWNFSVFVFFFLPNLREYSWKPFLFKTLVNSRRTTKNDWHGLFLRFAKKQLSECILEIAIFGAVIIFEIIL